MHRPLIRGEVVLDEAMPPMAGAAVIVRLLDPSQTEGPAALVAEQTIRDVPAEAQARRRLPFALDGPAPDPHAHYTVSVHVDYNGDGRVRIGDWLTVESYPVLTFGWPDHVTVHLKPVV